MKYKKLTISFQQNPYLTRIDISKTNFAKSILLLPQSVKPTENSWHFDWFIHTCNFPGMCAAPMSISQSLKHAICIIILYILLLLEHKPELQKWKNTKIIKAKKIYIGIWQTNKCFYHRSYIGEETLIHFNIM